MITSEQKADSLNGEPKAAVREQVQALGEWGW